LVPIPRPFFGEFIGRRRTSRRANHNEAKYLLHHGRASPRVDQRFRCPRLGRLDLSFYPINHGNSNPDRSFRHIQANFRPDAANHPTVGLFSPIRVGDNQGK
jgi:hypothetical protein